MFHELLKAKRQLFSLTQSELAHKLLVSTRTISNWENGKTLPDIENIILIAQHLNISLDVLFLGDQKMIEKVKEKKKLNRFYQLVGASLIMSLVIGSIMFLFLKTNHIPNISGFENNLSAYLSVPMFILTIYILLNIDWQIVIKSINKKIMIAIAILLLLYFIVPTIDMINGFILGWNESRLR